MNVDAERLDPRFGQNNLNLDTLTPEDLARYRNGVWLKGTKVPKTKIKNPSPPLVDATPFAEVVRALIDRGHHVDAIAAFCDVGYGTIRDLRDGKASIQQGTADKLRRMALLLPEAAS